MKTSSKLFVIVILVTLFAAPSYSQFFNQEENSGKKVLFLDIFN